MILNTGCVGFIGFHLAQKLLKQKNEVLGIDNFLTYLDKNLKKERLKILKSFKKFTFLKKDLKNFQDLKIKLKKKKIETLSHLAAQPVVSISIKNPHKVLVQNLNTFSNIIEIVRILNIKKFLYVSSSSVYGDTKTFPFTEIDKSNIPVSVYGATKLCNEVK